MFRCHSNNEPPSKRLQQIIAMMLITVLALFSLSACWSKIEMNQLAIIMGIAVDAGSKPDTYLITIQVAKASGLKSPPSGGGGGDSDGEAYVNFQHEGTGIHAAMYEIERMLSRKIYTAHNQVIIISEKVAKKNIIPVVDYFIRSAQGRFTVSLLIAKDKAADVLTINTELERMPIMQLQYMLEAQRWGSESASTNIFNFLVDMLSAGTAPIIPIIELHSGESDKPEAKLTETAVFIDKKMIGTLNKQQTRMMLILKNKASQGYLRVDALGGYVTLEFTDSSTKIEPHYKNGEFRMQVSIKEKCTLIDTNIQKDTLLISNKQKIEKKTKETIQRQLDDMMQHCKDLGADVIGMGELLYYHYPKESKALIDKWPEEFKNLQIDYEIDIELLDTGSTLKPIIPKEEFK